jgi:hypothetical protein
VVIAHARKCKNTYKSNIKVIYYVKTRLK